MSQSFPIAASDRGPVILTATAGQTAFAVSEYGIQDVRDVVVQRSTDAGVSYSTLVLGTDYSISGAGVAGGFTINTVVGSTVGWKIKHRGLAVIENTTDFSPANAFKTGGLNTKLDRQFIHIQELRRDVDDALALNFAIGTVAAGVPAVAIRGALPNLILDFTLPNTSTPFDVAASYTMTGQWNFSQRVKTPAGTATAPGVAVGQLTSGLTQLSTNLLSFVNQWQGSTNILQNHGNVSVADNHSLVIGSPTGVLMRVNHGAIEINRLGKKLSGIGASVPMQLNEWESDTSASEPIVFYRSRATTKGGTAAVQASDVLGLIQGQGDDGAGGTNPVAVNIGMRVTPGATVSADLVPGQFYIATQDQAGTPLATRFKVWESGACIQTGALMFGSGDTVMIDASRNSFPVNVTASGFLSVAGISTLTGNVTGAGFLKTSSATGGIGYATGAGGDVTQATNKTTGVTLNTMCGRIIMNNANLAAATPEVQFTLTNSNIAIDDNIRLVHRATGTFGAYSIQAQPAAGSAIISVRNVSGADKAEAIQLNFIVLKGVKA